MKLKKQKQNENSMQQIDGATSLFIAEILAILSLAQVNQRILGLVVYYVQ